MSSLYPKLDGNLESDQMVVTEPVTGTTGPRRSETVRSIQSEPGKDSEFLSEKYV